MLKPNWLRPKFGTAVWKAFLVISDLFWKKPNAEPSHLLVPRRLSALITYDPAREYSASYGFTNTRNCSSASWGSGEPVWPSPTMLPLNRLFISTPSTYTLKKRRSGAPPALGSVRPDCGA